jgi:hypothetical protein
MLVHRRGKTAQDSAHGTIPLDWTWEALGKD